MSREDNRRRAREAKRADQVAPTTAPARRRVGPGQYLQEVRSELRKVNWPTRSEVANYTVVVLVTTAFLTTVVWAFDWLISNAVLNVFG